MVDNQFRIIDKTKESEKAKDNLHFSKRGATCTDLHVNQIVIILSNLNIEPKDLQKYNFIPQYPLSSDEIEKAKIKIKGDKTKVEQKDIDNLNEKQIWIAYAWLLIHEKNKSKNKEYLCDIILDYMDDKDLIFRVTQNI
jgi:hypothetical protein